MDLLDPKFPLGVVTIMASIEEIKPGDEGSSHVEKTNTNTRFLDNRFDNTNGEDFEKAVNSLPRDEKFRPLTAEDLKRCFANPDFTEGFQNLLQDKTFLESYGIPE